MGERKKRRENGEMSCICTKTASRVDTRATFTSALEGFQKEEAFESQFAEPCSEEYLLAFLTDSNIHAITDT